MGKVLNGVVSVVVKPLPVLYMYMQHTMSTVRTESFFTNHVPCTCVVLRYDSLTAFTNNTTACIVRTGKTYALQPYTQDKEEMLKQLKTLEREDRTHRQKMLATMPVIKCLLLCAYITADVFAILLHTAVNIIDWGNH